MGSDAKGGPDARLVWAANRMYALLGLRSERYDKFITLFMSDAKSVQATLHFFSNTECPFCFFHPTAESVTANASELPTPAQLKKKAIVMHRASRGCEITSESIAKRVIILELTPKLMTLLNGYCVSIYLSTLMNPSNQRAWPEPIAKDLMDKYNVFLANLHVTLGLTKGCTWLPPPPRDAVPAATVALGVAASAEVKERIHVLEGSLITWTKQIRHVLRQDPEMLMSVGNNPEPNEELRFWQNKAMNLNSINQQLGMDVLKKVLKTLEAHQSTYLSPFKRLLKEVEDGRHEANDNVVFLSTLKDRIEKLMEPSADFELIVKQFDGLLHNTLLIWRYSRFYKSPTRLAMLLRGVCNTVISQARRYVSGVDVFEMIAAEEAPELLDKLNKQLHVCLCFKNTFFHYSERAILQDGVGWKMKNNAVFVRLDVFIERCHDVISFTRTVIQYRRLERIEIGGTKGRILSGCIITIFEEFQLALEAFIHVSYDIMDVDDRRFDDDFSQFRATIKDLDQRLGSLLSEAFSDLDTVQQQLKLLDSFEGMYERPLIQAELDKRLKAIHATFLKELSEVERVFVEDQDKVDCVVEDAPIHANFPPVAGALYWSRCLRSRITEPMGRVVFYNQVVKQIPDEFAVVEKRYESVLALFEDYDQERYSEWQSDSVDLAREKLNMKLLRRQEKTGLLKVNFDRALTRILREVRFFFLLDIDVPEAALEVFRRFHTYRKWQAQLEEVVSMYNSILTSLLPIEEPLLEDRIDKMDDALTPGLINHSWRSEGMIPEFIDNATRVVSDASNLVDVLKGNLRSITRILSSWCEEPLIERRRGARPQSTEEFDITHKEHIGKRLVYMSDGGKDIHKLVKDSNETLKISKLAPTWRAYVDFVSNIVIEGFVLAIIASLKFLCEILDPDVMSKMEMQPIFEVKVELRDVNIVFDPPFQTLARGEKSLRKVIIGWLKDFFSTVTVMQRIDTHSGDYLTEVKEHFHMHCQLGVVTDLLNETEHRCMEYRQSFMKYSYLWNTSLEKTFEQFLCQGARDLVQGFREDDMDFNSIMERVKVDIGRPIPSLEIFDDKISELQNIKSELSKMKTPVDIHWLRVNAQPLKLALVAYARQWETTHIDFLKDFAEQRIYHLMNFITKVKRGLSAKSPVDHPDDENLLYATMMHIRDVKLARNALTYIFHPVRELCQFLKKHHVQHRGLAELEQAPSQWEEVIRLAFAEKEKIIPLQNEELLKIRHKIDGFAEYVANFRVEFIRECPFVYDSARSYDECYETIDRYFNVANQIRARADDYNNLELLFDIAMTNYSGLHKCFEDLVLLKHLWDGVVLVCETFASWGSILWDRIDTEELVYRVREITTQVKNMPKAVQSWGLHKWLKDQVNNMGTVLPLINDLHSETMRERHWTTLMTVTQKSFEKGPDFCFKNLLDLNLHGFAEDVSEIVDQSVKEAKIEKKLLNIRSVWSKMLANFDFSNPDCPLHGELGDVLERLDSDSLDMVAISSQGRFIEFCKPLVNEWAVKLRTIDTTLALWQKVQANWCRLEPIFMQSDDIRAQLPEDSKRFEQLDMIWKDLMLEASQSSLIVEICCTDGREETLLQISEDIEICEHSLNDYLEQKKKAFPRFYFVANQALLNILSNGNKPLKVANYLGDVFDGVKTLDFSRDPENGKVGCGHFAKDGEVVKWFNDVLLDGAVENYLSALEQHIRCEMRELLEHAKIAAEAWETEKPREVWLEDYCAQLSLVTTQLVWTEETTRCFEELEAGSENAMKEYKRLNDDRIERLIKRVQTPLHMGLRTKIITIITIDVHSRDIIESFVVQKITEVSDFKWASQLRFYWSFCPQDRDLVTYTADDKKTCVIKICDWVTIYCYEYVGNCGRLVITPLTDRCYITLTQALNLNLGGAPAGPAGTGKTETTKDLSRAIGLFIVVFNCSDQMTYQTMAQIFMGLAQTGAWGCFDEFNRISIEVLSVVSTQYKSILDAIRARAQSFLFMDDEIRIVLSVGAFITMNPGYAGRTELPESIKALFRSVAMIVPDLKFICENMLMSEGFINARPLANKFVQLYALCSELLSKQLHYDWGLRAVKSLLRQAGSLKRKEPESDENPVLCRALRDFNTPKITTLDMPIFLRLIQDLFPGIWPAPFTDPKFHKVVAEIAKARNLQPDPQFIIKVTGLLDILHVRHCCFIIGPTGCGKTETWKTLLESVKAIGQDGMCEQANPKAVTSDELYGTMSKTKEWKDGLIAVIMRNMSKDINGYKQSHQWKWVLLDGDIDATWIESMNTVMDDNKVLTLVSNERIAFTPSMRMLFEVQDMKHASPATVSRGGVLYINETDIGWKPYVDSWRERMDSSAQNTFYLLFSHYFETSMDSIRKSFGFVCPILDMGFVQSITNFLDALIYNNTKDNMEALRIMGAEELKVAYDAFFVFSVMWSIGGALADDKIVNHRKAFNGFMRSLAKVRFPDAGECYDYRFDPLTREWAHWDQWVQPYSPVADCIFQNIVVSNVELERMKYVLDLNMHRKKAVLFVGVAGTGKTTFVKDYLADIKAKTDEITSMAINNNSYTTSFALQAILMSCLDKRTGKTYGPPGNKKCIFFIDDLNMPHVDKYDTQSAIMLLTQILSYSQVYDRVHLEEKKEITDVLFASCMNPKAGSFMINARLQRHFTVFTAFTPTTNLINGIYSQILDKHLQGFVPAIQKLGDHIVHATIDTFIGSGGILHTPCFLPSAPKFHYQFSLKTIANIFQGLLKTNSGLYRDGPCRFVQVWLHECFRTCSDRLINADDQAQMRSILEKICLKHFVSLPREELFGHQLIVTSFMTLAGGNEKAYVPVKDMASLKKVMETKLTEHNESCAAMPLVLFDDAIAHVCRITRITDNPCGNALLIGVGGSGKQSLGRLASFINAQDVLKILVSQNYGMNDLKGDLQDFYKKAVVRPGLPVAFMMTDGQIADERFLVYINDMLSSGTIPDLFTRDEYDTLLANIRIHAKAFGYTDDREGLFAYFIDKFRKNLHFILCHSPVGDTFRIRGRKFPAIISCMELDMFMAWPRDALEGVAKRNLNVLNEKGNISDEATLQSVASSMAEVHVSIDGANKRFLAEERRFNYTTPKSFLELINFYIKMLTDRQAAVALNIERLERGLGTMEQVQENVHGLKEDLKIKMVQVEEKKVATGALIDQVTKSSALAASEKEIADAEEEKTTKLANEAAALAAQADHELREAMPAMNAAKEAVNCLDKNSITELKSFTKPPPECAVVCAACAFLLKNEAKKIDWRMAQKMMNNPLQFIEEVKGFNPNVIPRRTVENTDELIALPFFNYETMAGKSKAAANLANWVVNVIKYNKIYVKVEPLMIKVKEAKATEEQAQAELVIVKQKVAEIQAQCAKLEKKLSDAVQEKEHTEAEATSCLEKLSIAERLVHGLSDEYDRWTHMVKQLQDLEKKLIGNCLLASAFVGYISPFSARFRLQLWQKIWTPDIVKRNISMTERIDPLLVLCNDADMAGWQNEGLPSDRISLENASVVTSCQRWPLMIDPQLQGVKWIKQRINEDLTVLQFTMNRWLEKVFFAIQMGGQLLIEAVGDEIDAILEPVLSRAVIKRGRSFLVMRIGGEEIDYDSKFQLYLQSKLSNPHYRPEIAAQCTIINFIVTPAGLEDQILAMVVNVEKPELEQRKQALVRQQNDFKMALSQLEDDLLSQLSGADPSTILDNLPLIEGLEKTKATSLEIAEQVKEAQTTEIEINKSRELYRPVAAEGSMLFFLTIQLCIIEHMYQYSLDSFQTFLFKAIDRTLVCEDVAERTNLLIAMIRMVMFRWVNRGLFEKHKLIFCTMLTFRLLQLGSLPEDFNTSYFNFLLRGPEATGALNPLIEWLPNKPWWMSLKLSELEGFETFALNMEKDAPSRFKDWFNELAPENVKLPLEWKKLDNAPFQKLLVLRCLRPDRIAGALANWIRQSLPNGPDYIDCDASCSFQTILSSSYDDSTNTTPIFFILSPGADPVKEVEELGKKLIKLQIGLNYHNVAMGQGQDVVAMAKLELGHRDGHWVMLQNIHLMPRWCVELEKKLDVFAIENSHLNFRLYLSADPSDDIPIGLLERSIKLTNEPPQGMLANLRRAFALFSKEDFEERDTKVKAILFGLCHFHALMLERKKFGALGYNVGYNFSSGDLRDSAAVLYNYLEGSTAIKIPWDDLRYIFGDIMYGGHIVDDWDRRMCEKYLLYFMKDELLDDLEMIPYADGKLSWPSPTPGQHKRYLEHIETMPLESPLFFGMHPNAEIGFRTAQCDDLFDMLMILQPRESVKTDADNATHGDDPMAFAEVMCADILEEVQDRKFATDDLNRNLTDEEKGPYQYVFMQECDYMNGLISEMVRCLSELQLGFKGELTMNQQMEELAQCLWTEKLPLWWVKLGFPSTRPLRSWRLNLQERCAQLDDWIHDPLTIPRVVDVSKLFNPQSFLTAIKQLCCQQQQLELDRLQVFTEVTKRSVKQVENHSRDGAFVTGMFLEGARWDITTGTLEDSRPKEMFVQMPVINCKAGLMVEREDTSMYICPTYCVPTRRPHYVFAAQLRTRQPAAKWVLAGVAMILDIGGA